MLRAGQSANVDDVGFVTALVKAILADLPIESSRVYATGISNGGLLAYRLACATDIFTSIGPDLATMLGPCADPHPISVQADGEFHAFDTRRVAWAPRNVSKRWSSGAALKALDLDALDLDALDLDALDLDAYIAELTTLFATATARADNA